MAKFSIKTDLLKLKNSFITSLKGNEKTKLCLVIPIEDAGLYVGEKGVYLSMTAFEMREERHGDTHVLKQSLPKEVYLTMTEEERNAMPLLGSLKPLQPAAAKEAPATSMSMRDLDESFSGSGVPF